MWLSRPRGIWTQLLSPATPDTWHSSKSEHFPTPCTDTLSLALSLCRLFFLPPSPFSLPGSLILIFYISVEMTFLQGTCLIPKYGIEFPSTCSKDTLYFSHHNPSRCWVISPTRLGGQAVCLFCSCCLPSAQHGAWPRAETLEMLKKLTLI